MDKHSSRESLRRAVAIATIGLLGATACSVDAKDHASPATVTTTTIEQATTPTTAPEKPVEKLEGVATEVLRTSTLPLLSSVFDRVYNGRTQADSVARSTELYDTYRTEEATLVRGNETLEMSRGTDTRTGEVTDVFARIYIPGSSLSDEERQNNTSSDNPEGNRYMDDVRISKTYVEQGIRVDAFAHDDEGYSSTQGDIPGMSSGFVEPLGDPAVAAKRAAEVANEMSKFVG